KSQKEYEQAAIELATDPAKLAQIKDKLAQKRVTAAVFDTKIFARNIESAYEAMYRRYQAGLPAEHIRVSGMTSLNSK
ncbi:MAG: hypothetical protein QOF09_1819, partial [Alphaproteobacteria bacterium]|nr:hypothetical protein [Alphaproteobacteria bacterium]